MAVGDVDTGALVEVAEAPLASSAKRPAPTRTIAMTVAAGSSRKNLIRHFAAQFTQRESPETGSLMADLDAANGPPSKQPKRSSGLNR
jgi:hypothetical protein